MFKRELRLPARTHIQQSRYFSHPLFRLKRGVNDLSVNRFAFVVKKSVDKRAVYRNRIRRLFRSCIEDVSEKLPVGYDMLFFLEKGIIDKSKEDLQKEVEDFLSKNHLFNENTRS